MINWSPLKTELALWRREGRSLPLWWRDDDAIADTPALRKLLTLSGQLALPVHVAVIPALAGEDLVAALGAHEHAVPVVHGWTHHNIAPQGAKKAEFGHPRADALAQTQHALEHLRGMFGPTLFDMFVPPWNRIDNSVVQGLAAQGYRALSTFTPRRSRQVAGLVQINTHIDPIHWRGGGGLADPDAVIAGIVRTLQDRRMGKTDAAEPLGFLSHHLVHDPAIWSFTEHCLGELLEGGATPCNLMEMKDLP